MGYSIVKQMGSAIQFVSTYWTCDGLLYNHQNSIQRRGPPPSSRHFPRTWAATSLYLKRIRLADHERGGITLPCSAHSALREAGMNLSISSCTHTVLRWTDQKKQIPVTGPGEPDLICDFMIAGGFGHLGTLSLTAFSFGIHIFILCVYPLIMTGFCHMVPQCRSTTKVK